MGYLHETDAWLERRLRELVAGKRDGNGIPALKQEIKEKILESYRNGQEEVTRRLAAVLRDFEPRKPAKPKPERKRSAPRQQSREGYGRRR